MSDEIQNIKIRIIGEADFSQLDQSLNKLTAEEKQLTDQIKAVDTAAKTANQSIQKEAQSSATAVNQTNKSFEGLRDQVKGVASQIPGAFQAQQIVEFARATQSAATGVSGVSTAMNVLKAAIIGTGIGALVIALISLTAYFTKTEAGGDRLAKILAVIGAVTESVVKVFTSLGEEIADAGASIIDYVTDSDSAKQSTDDYAKSVFELASEIADLQDQIEELSITIGLQNDKLQTGIENNLRALRNRNNTLDQSLGLIKTIGDLEEQKLKNSNTLLDKKLDAERKIFLQKSTELEIEQKAYTLEQEIVLFAAKQFITDDAIIAQRKEKAKLFDQFVKGEIDASTVLDKARGTYTQRELEDLAKVLHERESAVRESGNLIERLNNFKDAAIDKDNARIAREQAERDKAAAKEKQDADRKAKRLADLAKAAEEAAKREQAAYENLIEWRLTQEVKANDKIAKSDEKSDEDRISAINNRIVKENELSEAQRDYLINIKKVTGSDALLVEAQLDAKRIESIENGEKEKLAIIKKSNDDLLKENKKSLAKQEADEKESADKKKAIRQQEYQQSYQLVSTIANGFFQLQKENYDQDLTNLQAKQQAELKAVGDNKQAQAIINAKYAKEQAKIKTAEAESDKEQAEFNIILSTAQAVAKASPVLPLMALAASIGAVQLALVAAKPIPKFNKGTKSVPGHDTGDDSILAMLRPGEGVMPVDRMKDYKPAFDAIFDRRVPADFLNSMVMDYDRMGRMIPVTSGGDMSGLHSELKGLRKDISKLQVLQVNMDQKGFKTYLSAGQSKSQLENNYLRAE